MIKIDADMNFVTSHQLFIATSNINVRKYMHVINIMSVHACMSMCVCISMRAWVVSKRHVIAELIDIIIYKTELDMVSFWGKYIASHVAV